MTTEKQIENLELKLKIKDRALARYFRKTVSEIYMLIEDYGLPYKINIELDSSSKKWTEGFTEAHQVDYNKKI